MHWDLALLIISLVNYCFENILGFILIKAFKDATRKIFGHSKVPKSHYLINTFLFFLTWLRMQQKVMQKPLCTNKDSGLQERIPLSELMRRAWTSNTDSSVQEDVAVLLPLQDSAIYSKKLTLPRVPEVVRMGHILINFWTTKIPPMSYLDIYQAEMSCIWERKTKSSMQGFEPLITKASQMIHHV